MSKVSQSNTNVRMKGNIGPQVALTYSALKATQIIVDYKLQINKNVWYHRQH